MAGIKGESIGLMLGASQFDWILGASQLLFPGRFQALLVSLGVYQCKRHEFCNALTARLASQSFVAFATVNLFGSLSYSRRLTINVSVKFGSFPDQQSNITNFNTLFKVPSVNGGPSGVA